MDYYRLKPRYDEKIKNNREVCSTGVGLQMHFDLTSVAYRKGELSEFDFKVGRDKNMPRKAIEGKYFVDVKGGLGSGFFQALDLSSGFKNTIKQGYVGLDHFTLDLNSKAFYKVEINKGDSNWQDIEETKLGAGVGIETSYFNGTDNENIQLGLRGNVGYGLYSLSLGKPTSRITLYERFSRWGINYGGEIYVEGAFEMYTENLNPYYNIAVGINKYGVNQGKYLNLAIGSKF